MTKEEQVVIDKIAKAKRRIEEARRMSMGRHAHKALSAIYSLEGLIEKEGEIVFDHYTYSSRWNSLCRNLDILQSAMYDIQNEKS